MATGKITINEGTTTNTATNTITEDAVTKHLGRVVPNTSAGVEISPATSTQIGEVQASPTANTVLDRLKALLTGIVLSAGSAIIGKVGIDQTTPGTTNRVAATLDAETTKVIGTVNVAAAQTIAVTNAGTFAAQAVAAGDAAHDAADSGNPVKVGGKAYAFDGTAPQTAVAEGDRTNFICDPEGRQYVNDVHPFFWTVSADYAAAQTNASVKAAPGVGLSLYLTDIMISNGAVAGNVTLLDGSGGTVKLELYPAINGGCSLNLRTPIKLTANTALCITSTTVTTHSLTICGFTAA